MRKFVELYKEKLNESETLRESKILTGFQAIYNAMLEHYGLKSVQQLNEQSQVSFLTELNRYWSEEEGISEKGERFLSNRSMELNENSTTGQKKNFLRAKSYAVINETIRQTNLKDRLYTVIDEMYHQLNAENLRDILTPETIISVISESLNRSLSEFTSNISTELTESAKMKKKA